MARLGKRAVDDQIELAMANALLANPTDLSASTNLPGDVETLLGLAARFGLVATGGSDFHGDNKPNVRVGVAYGGLKVPDEAFDGLLARIAARRSRPADSSGFDRPLRL